MSDNELINDDGFNYCPHCHGQIGWAPDEASIVRATEYRIIKLLKKNLKLEKDSSGYSVDLARYESYLYGLEQSIEVVKGEQK